MANQPARFGKYVLMDLLAQGGMAEIYRARLASSDGAGRILVIKRIQNNYGENRDFLQMFQSEIKVTLGFNHPNIVQLYDFGEENGQPYIAMEWVDGRNLRQLILRSAEAKQAFPVELAAFIAQQAAAGLQYAHAFRDKISGEPLNIVHRDISPQNILISLDGSVKVIDFGIAKATTNSESTRAGVIKGKPSYLSPEQISGEVLDGRSDLFALGAVLWESLTGRKLFAADSDLAVLKLIESSSSHVKPPSLHNRAVPKELDDIVLRSLARQREKRFANCDDFARALHKFIYSTYNDFNPGDLADFTRNLFKNEIVEDRKKIQKMNSEIEVLLQLEPQGSEATTALPSSRESFGGSAPQRESEKRVERAVTFDLDEDSKSGKSSIILIDRPNHTSTSMQSPSTPSTPRSRSGTQSIHYSAPARQKPTAAIQKLDSKLSPASLGILACLGVLGVAAVGPNFGLEVPILSTLVGKGLNPSTPTVQRTISVSAQGETKLDTKNDSNHKVITLRFQISPGGGNPSIQLNGKTLPAGALSEQVQVDSPLEVVVNRAGYKTFQSQFVVDSKQVEGLSEWIMDIATEPLHFGLLTLHTTPSAKATITIDHTTWNKQTPLDNEKLPVGNYPIHLENDVLGMTKNIQVNIEEGKTITLDEQLEVK